MVEAGFDRFADHGLQALADDGQLDPGHTGDHRAVTGHRRAHLVGTNITETGLNATDTTVADLQARDLTVLDDIDPEIVRRPGKGPGHRVVAGDSTAPLNKTTIHRVAGLRTHIQQRYHLGDPLTGEHLAIHTLHLDCIRPAPEYFSLVPVEGKTYQAILAEHNVVVQLFTQSLIALERMLIEAGALRVKVIGTGNRGVAASVTTPDPTFFQYSDIGDAVILGQVVGGGQAMPSPADDHYVIAGF